MIKSQNKASTLQPLVTMNFDFVLAELSTDSKKIFLPNFTHKSYINLLYGFQALYKYAASWDRPYLQTDNLRTSTSWEISHGEIRP